MGGGFSFWKRWDLGLEKMGLGSENGVFWDGQKAGRIGMS